MVDAALDKPGRAAKAGGRVRRAHGDNDRLSSWQLFAFGLPAVPLAAMMTPMLMFLGPFYTGEMGITLTQWALLLGVTRVLDIVTDPLVGIVCDRLPSRWGRRRHWIVICSAPLMLGCALLFTPGYFTRHVTFAYLLFAYIMFTLAQTAKTLNSTAWGGELANGYAERTRIMGWRGLLANIAKLAAYGIPTAVEWLTPDASIGQRLEALMWFAVIATPVAVLISVISVPERAVEEDLSGAGKPKITAGEIASTLKAMVTNSYFRKVVAIQILQAAPMAIKQALFVFYIAYVMHAKAVTATLLLGISAAATLATPLWMRLARSREKHRILAVAILFYGCLQISWLFWGPSLMPLFVICVCLIGATDGGSSFLLQSMMADVVDSDTAKSGRQQTGAFFAVMETATKLAPALATLALFPVLQAVGFDPTGKHTTPESLVWMRVMVSVGPAVPILFSAYLLWTFPLGSKRHGELRAEIEAQRAASNLPPSA